MTERESQRQPIESRQDECLEMRIPARAEWVRVVRLATAGVASRVGFSYDDIEDIKLAVAEACNNAILHSSPASASVSGEPECDSAPVTIRWRVLSDGICISVTNEGRLDSAVPLARKPDNSLTGTSDLPEDGMGLLLIESLMDEVRHEFGPNSDTTMHMTKRIRPSSGQASGESLAQQTSGAASDEASTPASTSISHRAATGSEHKTKTFNFFR